MATLPSGPLPSGTVTFLFIDIEGSARRWGQRTEAMRAALVRHDALLRQAVEAHGGHPAGYVRRRGSALQTAAILA